MGKTRSAKVGDMIVNKYHPVVNLSRGGTYLGLYGSLLACSTSLLNGLGTDRISCWLMSLSGMKEDALSEGFVDRR